MYLHEHLNVDFIMPRIDDTISIEGSSCKIVDDLDSPVAETDAQSFSGDAVDRY